MSDAKKSAKGIFVFFVFDPGGNPEEEAQDAMEMSLDAIPIRKHEVSASPWKIPPSVDMLVVDYGGMMHGAYDSAASNIRECCRWAQEHPGKLVLIYTEYTAKIYANEVEAEFGHLDNILLFSSAEFEGIDAWEKRQADAITKILSWYDLEAIEPDVDVLITPPQLKGRSQNE